MNNERKRCKDVSEWYENEPLLYLDQPKLKKPLSQMQEEYVSFSAVKEKEETVNQEKNSSFKELSIDEKIDYLVELPKEFIQMKCKIETKDRTYRGSITNRLDDKIEFLQAGQQKITISIEDIKSIDLLGL